MNFFEAPCVKPASKTNAIMHDTRSALSLKLNINVNNGLFFSVIGSFNGFHQLLNKINIGQFKLVE
jgi:hypothetical protein